ncbi:MAG: hypothetical protein BWK73_47760 [Thiothrix lacustris]|uniref:Uncharacterized protein n=1 Tax=Thiothrix lacustris TaxID=525917 RepID=A0A1Y1QA16_9GAMM|nr:MAG: hypothetical protein BWK73_47760 [Thiothrix lacustris]
MSESQLVDLVVVGHTSEKSVEALVRDILNLLNDHSAHLEFKLSDALLFNNGMVSIRDNISTDAAQAISQKLSTLGVQCILRPTLQIVPKDLETEDTSDAATYTCPACGHKQAKLKTSHTGQMDACEACGIVGERYKKKQHFQQVVQNESQRNDNERAKRIREVLERAKLDEEAMLQQEARRQLGIAEKPDHIGMKIAGALAALSIALGGVYYYNQPTPAEIAQQAELAANAQAEKDAEKTAALDKAIENAQKMGEKLGDRPSADPTETTTSAPEAVPAAATTAARETKMTEALKADTQAPETPVAITAKKVQADVSATAISEMEGQQLTPSRFQISQEEHTENRRRIQQLLKLDEGDLTETLITQTKEAYPRTLLLLDIAEWQLQHQKIDNARNTIARIQQEFAQTQDITQQTLILGAISKAHLLLDEWEQGGKSLQQAIAKASELAPIAEQVNLLTRLANEQALFGNQIAARQVLESAATLSATLPKGVEPRSSSFVQLASAYAMLTDFAEANKFLPNIEDTTKRQKLVEFIDKLQHRVEQVRAEYLQTAQTSPP